MGNHDLYHGACIQCVTSTVYDVDRWSGGRDIITALLQDPFITDKEQNSVIQSRWKDRDRSLTIEWVHYIDLSIR